MSFVQLGKVVRLWSPDCSPFSLLLLLDSVRPGEVVLSDKCEEVACKVTEAAERKIQEGSIQPGDIVSLGRYYVEQGKVVLESMERLTRNSGEYLVFSQLAPRPDKDCVSVQARVVAIGQTRTYSSGFGPKPFFNLAILDEAGAEVIVSFFSQEAVKFAQFFQVGECYDFLRFRLDQKSPKSTAQFRFSLSADKMSCVQRNSLSLPQASFSLLPFEALQRVQTESIVDIAGVLTVVGDLNQGRNRLISLVNSLNQKVEITLWGALAEDNYGIYRGRQPIVVAKRLQLKSAQRLSVLEGLSDLLFNVTGLKEVELLQQWKASLPTESEDYIPIQRPLDPGTLVPRSLAAGLLQVSIRELLRIGREQGWGQKLSLIASIQRIEDKTLDNVMYPACLRAGCLKSVSRNADSVFVCVKCGYESLFCTYRYILRMTLCDDQKDEIAVTAFDARAQELLGLRAADLRNLGEETAFERFTALEGRSWLWTVSRNERNLHLSESYIVEALEAPRREYEIE